MRESAKARKSGERLRRGVISTVAKLFPGRTNASVPEERPPESAPSIIRSHGHFGRNYNMPIHQRSVTFALGRRAAFIACLCVIATPAAADEDIPKVVSPLAVEPDRNAVNLSTGQLNVQIPTLSVPADPRLKFDKVQNSAPYVTGTTTSDQIGNLTSSWSIHYGGDASEAFKCREATCKSVNGSGSVFYEPTVFIRAPSAERYDFTLLASRAPSADSLSTGEQRYAQSVSYPDGETISYDYQAGSNPNDPFPPCTTNQTTGDCQTFYRPIKISSSTGYYITISYQSSGSDISVAGWSDPAQAAIYSPTGLLLRRFVYGSDGSITDYGDSATNVGGRTFLTSGVGNGLGSDVETASATVQLPGESSASLALNRDPTYPVIVSLARDSVLWNYAYTNLRLESTAQNSYHLWDALTVTGPNGYRMSYDVTSSLVIPPIFTNRIVASTDALGRQTTYGYDTAGRVDHMVLPEGNSIDLLYAGNGLVLTKTTHPKPNSGLADLVERLDYNGKVDGCADLGDPVLCYRPTSYTDALGRITNYSYNSNGQLTQQLDPAVNAIRRQTNITYTTSGISRKKIVRICGGASCSGNAESHVEYTYFGNTRLPLTVTQVDEATGQSRTTGYAYDAAGRVTRLNGPLPGTDDAKYFKYDKFGRKIWEIGELATNGLRLAKRFTYRNSDDKVTKVESGTVACATDCDLYNLSLSPIEITETIYDDRRYPVRERTYKDAINYSVTDRSFLDRGLAECTTVRMNLTSLPQWSAHGACALGTAGTAGSDRITKNSYDSDGRLTLVQKAYTTPRQANYVSYTYTPNGKQQTVTDANGNKARFVYDGFDRLSQWQFPSKTTTGAINTADYEQYGYDAVGNRISLRKRDGSTLAFTYDALNRMTSKVATAVAGGGDTGGGDPPPDGGDPPPDGGGTTNSPPVANVDEASVSACGSVTVMVTSNDTDADADPLTVTSVSSGSSGTASIVLPGSIKYKAFVPSGSDAIDYTISDGNGGTDSSTLFVSIGGGVCN